MSENLAGALVELQAALPSVTKGKKASVKTESGTYTYDYADLAAISAELLPKLAEVGLSFSAKPTVQDGVFVLVYTLRHTSGESDGGVYPLPDPGKTKPQALGSAITYARRYALCSITGLAPESDDDDARAANKTRRAAQSEEAVLAQLKGDIWALAKSRGIDGAGVVSRYEEWGDNAMSDATVEDLRGFLKHMRSVKTVQRKPAEDPAAEDKVEWPEPALIGGGND